MLLDWLIVVAGTVLWTVALVILSRATRDLRMSIWGGKTARRPPAAYSMLSLGGLGVAAIGGTRLERYVAFWGLLAVVALLVLTLGIAVFLHNRSIDGRAAKSAPLDAH